MQLSQEQLIEIVGRDSTIYERLEYKFSFEEKQENNDIVNFTLNQWCQVTAQGNWDEY